VNSQEAIIFLTLILIVLTTNLIFLSVPTYLVSFNTLVSQGASTPIIVGISFAWAFGFLIFTAIMFFVAQLIYKLTQDKKSQ
jgi:hypothetical protein